jgi:hypothetical protein
VVQWRLHFFPEEAIFPEPSVQKRSYDINPIFLGRCFFLFQSGLLGVGPPGTQRGLTPFFIHSMHNTDSAGR